MKLFFALVLTLVGGPAFGAVAMPSETEARYLLNTGQAGALYKARLGHQVIDKSTRIMKATYSTTFYTSTTVGLYTLRDVDGEDARLPKNALIQQIYIDTLVDVVGMGPQLTLSVGASAIHTDMLNGWTPDRFRSTMPRYAFLPPQAVAGGTMTNSTYKLASASTVDVLISGSGIKHGKFNVYIEYLLGDQALDQASHAAPN